MNFGLLTYYERCPLERGNLGDYMQSLAAMNFLPRIDHFIEREDLSAAQMFPETFVIMNGWFLHDVARFPPPDNIHPFYISFHIADPAMLTPAAISYLRRHEPIGCRDYSTLHLLNSRGISAYFSGCLTLTLQARPVRRENFVCIVDPEEPLQRMAPAEVRTHAVSLTHQTDLIRSKDDFGNLMQMRPPESDTAVPFFTEEELTEQIRRFEARWSSLPVSKNFSALSTTLNLARAQLHLDIYAKARLVLTKYLHCTMPCLAIGTPVILWRYEAGTFQQRAESKVPERFSALMDYIPVYSTRDASEIDWSPAPPDVHAHAKFLSLIVRDAVRIQGNPLMDTPLETYYEMSGWLGGPGAGRLRRSA